MRGRAVVARRAHNPEVLGSNPSPATRKNDHFWSFFDFNLQKGTMSKPRYLLKGHLNKVPFLVLIHSNHRLYIPRKTPTSTV